jgi:hypothetical protein
MQAPAANRQQRVWKWGNISVSDKLEGEIGEIGEIGEDWAKEVENSCKAHCFSEVYSLLFSSKEFYKVFPSSSIA